MGARLYNPVSGLFTSTDPVYGGNNTTYLYPTDPLNASDLDGKAKRSRCWKPMCWVRASNYVQSRFLGEAAARFSRRVGGQCSVRYGMRTCRSSIKIYGRGGTTIGDTYLTGWKPSNVRSGVIAHEREHRRQWRRYGAFFAMMYFNAGRNPCRNVFERAAGLRRGGYKC